MCVRCSTFNLFPGVLFCPASPPTVYLPLPCIAGEFGCAMVYLHEIAPANKKGLVGSIGFASAMSGCMLGVLAVVIVEATFNPGKQQSLGHAIPRMVTGSTCSAVCLSSFHECGCSCCRLQTISVRLVGFVVDHHAIYSHNWDNNKDQAPDI